MEGEWKECNCNPPCKVNEKHGKGYRRIFFQSFPSGWPTNSKGTPDKPGWYKCPRCNVYIQEQQRCPPTFTVSALHIDHIIPKNSSTNPGKIHCIRNLRPMCWYCNISKSDNVQLKHKILSGNPRLIQWIERMHSKFKETETYDELPTREEARQMSQEEKEALVKLLKELAQGQEK